MQEFLRKLLIYVLSYECCALLGILQFLVNFAIRCDLRLIVQNRTIA